MPWQVMPVICTGGISYTRADYTEAGSGGMFKTADDYCRAMSGLTMYPEVTLSTPIFHRADCQSRTLT